MSGVVEHVARAIAMEEGIAPAKWPVFLEAAKTAIAALRDPTVEMIGAGATAGAVSNDAAVAVWQAMIDCAAS